MSDLFGIEGSHVLVTGGSSGLGRFFATLLAARGARVTVGARRAEALAKTVDDIAAAHRSLTDRGVTFAGAPRMIHRHEATGTEEWMAFFDDSEGNLLAITSRVPGH